MRQRLPNRRRTMSQQPHGKTSACLWCGTAFQATRQGGHVKRFCGARHRAAFHSAARRWVHRAVEVGLLSVADLKAARLTCTLHRRASKAGRVSEGQEHA
jgi:hypothetical protein